MTDQNNLIVILVSIVALMVLMCSFIFVFVLKYRQKQNEFEQEKQQIRLEQEKALAQVELEISEDLLRNISHEIHDNIGHSLSIAKLTLHGLNASNHDEKSKSTIDILTRTIVDLRNLSKSMNGAYIREIGLHAALQREVEMVNSSGNIRCSFNASPNPMRTSENNEIILFRCIQEAVNNSLKHAHAQNLEIESTFTNHQLILTVKDDGVGFDTSAISFNGIGIGSMKERVRLMGGKINLISSPHSGTKITFEIPISSEIN